MPNCYAEFSQDGLQFHIGERKWIAGAVLLIAFSPAYYLLLLKPQEAKAPLWVAWLVMGLIFFVGIWWIGFYRKTLFDKSSGFFQYERGFFGPFTQIDGALGEIENVNLHSTVSTDSNRNHFTHSKLMIRVRGSNLILAEAGPGTNLKTARRLAVLVGCGLILSGRIEIWGVQAKGDYIETAEEARKNIDLLDSGRGLE